VSATVDRLTALLGEATPGPWETRTDADGFADIGALDAGSDEDWGTLVVGRDPDYGTDPADAALIAEARNALGALLAVAEAAEAWVDAATDDPALWAGDEDWALIGAVAALSALDGGTGGAG
jgi:hypothetical protein